MSLIGIDLGGTNVRVGKVNSNAVEQINSARLLEKQNQNSVLEQIYNAIDEVIDKEVKGIGVGVPSVVDTINGIVYDVQNIPSWKEVPLKKLLEEKYNIPTYINNDANCFAVGEKHFGKGKGYQDIVGLIAGTGLGSGLIFNNKLYAGRNCGAGEFGMLPFKDHNFEYYCCGQFFTNIYNLKGEEVYTLAETGDKKSMKIFEEFGSNLGEAIKVILYSVDPQIIVLGGSTSKSFKYFKEAMWKIIETFEYKKSLTNLKIEVSEIKEIAILGAAALYLDSQSN
jgi:glucokinase